GTDALGVLGHHLAGKGTNCLVGFRLDRALVGDLPVTRGVCSVRDGVLSGIAERRKVTHRDGVFLADDGEEPATLDPSALVSMNLWGFAASMWEELHDAMSAAEGASEDDEEPLHRGHPSRRPRARARRDRVRGVAWRAAGWGLRPLLGAHTTACGPSCARE